MGNQKTVTIGEELSNDLGGPIADHHGKKNQKSNLKTLVVLRQGRMMNYQEDCSPCMMKFVI